MRSQMNKPYIAYTSRSFKQSFEKYSQQLKLFVEEKFYSR